MFILIKTFGVECIHLAGNPAVVNIHSPFVTLFYVAVTLRTNDLTSVSFINQESHFILRFHRRSLTTLRLHTPVFCPTNDTSSNPRQRTCPVLSDMVNFTTVTFTNIPSTQRFAPCRVTLSPTHLLFF